MLWRCCGACCADTDVGLVQSGSRGCQCSIYYATFEAESLLACTALAPCTCAAGPAKKHQLIHMDSTGQPHQHHDHLISPKASNHSSRQHEQQQPSRQGPAGQAAAVGAAAAVAASAGAAASSAAAAPPAQEFGAATDVQLEELEALESILASEYSLVSSSPPHFVVKLREPGSEDLDEGQQLPASALFNLRFKLPKVSYRMLVLFQHQGVLMPLTVPVLCRTVLLWQGCCGMCTCLQMRNLSSSALLMLLVFLTSA